MPGSADLTPEELAVFRRWASDLQRHVEEELGRFGLLEKIRLEYNDLPYSDPPVVKMLDAEGHWLCTLEQHQLPSRELAHFLFGLLGKTYAPEGFEVTDSGFGSYFFRLGVQASALLFPETGVAKANLPPPVKR